MLNTPSKCSCGHNFLANHALVVVFQLSDITSYVTNVCHNVATEPRLQPLSDESLNTPRSAITTDNARHDIRARGFWSSTQDAYFDVRVFHTHAMSNASGPISVVYRKHEAIKKRAYGQCVRDIEHRVFTPLVFSTTKEMGPEATTFYKRLADMLASSHTQL